MTRGVKPFKNKKTQELIQTILEVFPNSWLVEIRRVDRSQWGRLCPPARKGHREPDRAGAGGRWPENYELFGNDWNETGGGT